MKICVIGTRGFPNVQGGIETHCNELYKRLSNIYNHKIIVFRKKPYIKNDVRIINIKFIDIWVPKNKLLETFIHSFLATIYSLFLKPDIIHYHNTGPAIFSPIPKLFKIKILFTYHNISYTQRKWNFIAKKFLMFSEKVALSSASQIIFISPQIKNHSLSVIKELSESTIIPNGVNIPEKSHSLSYLKSIDLEPNKYFLAVGRFLEEKGFDYMIESFLSMELNDYKLVIAGDSDYETSYSRKLKQMVRNNHKIVLTGFIKGEKLNQLFTNAKLFIFPSLQEGNPIALLEAMSYGIDVIASDIDANLNIGLNKDLYFKVKDKESLKRAIINRLNSNKIYDYSEILRNYDWEKVVEKTNNVLLKLIRNSND